MKNIYVVSIEHEIYGPFNERGLKPLVASSMCAGSKTAYATREEAEKAITDMLNMHETVYTAWIGRQPDSRIDKLDTDNPEAYIAYNVEENDVEKTQMCYPDVVAGGAIEVIMHMEEVPFFG